MGRPAIHHNIKEEFYYKYWELFNIYMVMS
jgi:hypothetical protein